MKHESPLQPIIIDHCSSWAILSNPKHATLYFLYITTFTVYSRKPPCCTCANLYFTFFFFFDNLTMSLPTPAMSGEFIIQDKNVTDTFTLPPAALSPQSRRSSRSDPSYVPASPTSPDLSGRRASHTGRSAVKRPLEDFDLPPPPTRTRKIIQMKPKSLSARSAKTKDNGKDSQQSSEPAPNPSSGSKRKQPSATSAAGRKIARKTAHSLIERRRRSKMNEEFGTLKDMIPACTGQEMHKLAILQVLPNYLLWSRSILTIPKGKH